MSEPVSPKTPFDAAKAGRVGAGIIRGIFRRKLLWAIVALFVFMYIGANACTTYVPPNMVAVRQVYYGSNAGIREELYQPGLHFVLAGYERLHMFPRDLEIINFSSSGSETSAAARTAAAINVQTSDGYKVVLDVSVLYRVVDAHHVFVEAGPGRAYEDKLVIPRADQIMRKTLGELNSEEFYQGPRRIEKARAAQEQLAAELLPYGIELAAVLVRRYVYDDKYQQLIEGRKIEDQTVFLRQAEAKAAIELRKRDTIIAEGKANQEVELSRGAAEVQKLKSQADLYRRKQAAAGNLVVALAEAKGTQLENDALQGAGSENMVGLRMAEVLKGVKVLVLPSDGPGGMNPLDLNSMLNKFEVK